MSAFACITMATIDQYLYTVWVFSVDLTEIGYAKEMTTHLIRRVCQPFSRHASHNYI